MMIYRFENQFRSKNFSGQIFLICIVSKIGSGQKKFLRSTFFWYDISFWKSVPVKKI